VKCVRPAREEAPVALTDREPAAGRSHASSSCYLGLRRIPLPAGSARLAEVSRGFSPGPGEPLGDWDVVYVPEDAGTSPTLV
jgi:hypothetical protein